MLVSSRMFVAATSRAGRSEVLARGLAHGAGTERRGRDEMNASATARAAATLYSGRVVARRSAQYLFIRFETSCLSCGGIALRPPRPDGPAEFESSSNAAIVRSSLSFSAYKSRIALLRSISPPMLGHVEVPLQFRKIRPSHSLFPT